jgi:hypothetical protein
MAVAVVLLLISSGSVTFLLRFLAALWCDRRVSQSCRAVVFTYVGEREIELHTLHSRSSNSAPNRPASQLGPALAGARREPSHTLRLQL